jgi:hypothetical protein
MTVDREVGCDLHKSHDPEPTYLEVHHVIPQAWQATWQPGPPWPFPGSSPDRSGLNLWDNRTVTVCRTGHGNIHHWIVQLMEAARDRETDDVGSLLHIVRSGLVLHRPGRADYECAAQALWRFQEAGGELATLIAARQYGAI